MAPLRSFRLKKSAKNRLFFKIWLNFSLITACFGASSLRTPQWGFWAHKRINRLAVYRLPPQMQVFYKAHIDYIAENATNPDKRRYSVIGEAERHFIDLDVYGDSALGVLPKYWPDAIKKIGEDSLRKHGIVPWHVQLACHQLTEAFKEKDVKKILRFSADLGHYIADAHVPLHTTRNYNGQLTNQEGIHGFWESRLPELFAEEYNLWIGAAEYKESIPNEIWRVVEASHIASDSVFLFEKKLSQTFQADKKYSYELRNNILTRSYSRDFSEKYHQMLDGQVERRMKASVKMVGDMWYTCWVNAGQPDFAGMSAVSETQPDTEEQKSWLKRLFQARQEDD